MSVKICRFCVVRLYWAGDKLGKWNEFGYESFSRCMIDCSTSWPAVHHATTVLSDAPLHQISLNQGNLYFQKNELYLQGVFSVLFQVDAHNIVPCWEASPKLEYGARTIRNKINNQLPTYLTEFPPVIRHPHKAKVKPEVSGCGN